MSGPLVGLVLAASLIACEDEPRPQRVRPHLSADPRLAAVEGQCRAMCKLAGLCGFDEAAGRCLARSEEDCRRSDGCLTSGVCSFAGGGCVGASDADCRASEQCRAVGACTFTGQPHRPCEAAGDDCRQAAICRNEGACTAHGGRCTAGGALP